MAARKREALPINLAGVGVLILCGALIEFFPRMNHWLKAFLCLAALVALVLGERIGVWAGKGFRSRTSSR